MPYYPRVTICFFLITMNIWSFLLTFSSPHSIHLDHRGLPQNSHPSNPPPGQLSRPFLYALYNSKTQTLLLYQYEELVYHNIPISSPSTSWRIVATFEPKIEIVTIRKKKKKHKSHHNPPLLDWRCRHVARLSCISLCKNDRMAIDHLIGIQINIMTNPYWL